MKNKRQEKPIIASRVIVGVLGCMGCCLLMFLRSNLSVAIIAMVDEKVVIKENSETQDKDLCYDISRVVNTTNNTNSGYNGRYKWSESVQGIVLGSYFYGYSLTQFGGSFGDKFGAKWILGLGISLPAICNALIPVLADIHYSLVIVMRVMMGAFHGVVYSCLFSMIAKWFTPSEKSMMLTGVIFASNLGGVITMPLAGYLCKSDFLGGWPSVFYLTSIVHLIWFILWCYYVSNSPEEDQNMCESELEYILANNPNSRNVRNLSIPWKAILTSRPVWASIITKMSGSFGYYLLCAKMPTYLDTVFGMAIQTNSWFNSLMYATLCCSTIGAGPLFTWINNKQCISLTRNRKNFQTFGMLSCCVCIVFIPMVGCNSQAVISLLLIGMFLYGSITGGEFSAIPEYAPNYSGTVFGVANTLASTTGFVGPMTVGLLLDHGHGSGVRHQWNIIWYLTAAIYAFGLIVFELFGTSEPQSWAVLPNEPHKHVQKVAA